MLPILAGIAIPIVTELMRNGLTSLAGAVANKGQQYAEEKLGVKLEPNISAEKALELKQLEFDNEDDIRAWALEDRKLDIAEFQEEAGDKQSARLRDQAFLAVGQHNWRGDIMFFLAVCMIAILVYLIWKDQGINEYVKGIFTLVLGRFLGYLDNIYNYEFGTTRVNKTKDATIQQLSRNPNDQRRTPRSL